MNDVKRLNMILGVIDRRLTTHLAEERLGIYERKYRRLLQRYREDNPPGMPDVRRGKSSSSPLPEGLADHAIQIIRERYTDFCPPLVSQKLAELHGVVFSSPFFPAIMVTSAVTGGIQMFATSNTGNVTKEGPV